MSTPTPKALLGGAASASVLELAEKCALAVKAVEAHLRQQDVDGANEYLEAFGQMHGTAAHNAVMKMLEEIYGSPDWRTFS